MKPDYFFRQWPVKYKIASAISAGLMVFLLGCTVILLSQGKWKEAVQTIGFTCVFPVYIFQPEIFFIPISRSNMRQLQQTQHGFVRKLAIGGLILMWLIMGLNLFNKFFGVPDEVELSALVNHAKSKE